MTWTETYMLISHKFKFLTIDIPKTGSRSYRESLDGFLDITGQSQTQFIQHQTALSVKNEFDKNGWNWNSYFKYTTIRNPWVRYVSFYVWAENKIIEIDNMIKSKEPISQLEQDAFRNLTNLFKNNNYNQYLILKNIINQEPSQNSYFIDNNKILVDYIARTETISVDFQFLCNKVGITPAPALKHENKNKAYNYKDFYDQELIDLVAYKEKYIIENYNYQY